VIMSEQHSRTSLLGKIAVYTEILAKDPKSTIFVSLSEAYRKMGLFDDAMQVIEQGLETHPDFCPAHIILARIRCQQGDYQASEVEFLKALSLDKENLAGLVGYARLQILKGDESRARELLLDARALSPADPVINKLLLSLPAEPEYEEATAEEQSVTSMEEPTSEEPGPDRPSLVSATLAELYLQQGLERKALEIYRLLVLDEPNNLVLRRQIRDLEQKLSETPGEEKSTETTPAREAAEVELVDSASEAQPEESLVAEPGNQAEELPPAPDEAELTTANDLAATGTGTEQVLVTLNRWLDNIQQRRSDV